MVRLALNRFPKSREDVQPEKREKAASHAKSFFHVAEAGTAPRRRSLACHTTLPPQHRESRPRKTKLVDDNTAPDHPNMGAPLLDKRKQVQRHARVAMANLH